MNKMIIIITTQGKLIRIVVNIEQTDSCKPHFIKLIIFTTLYYVFIHILYTPTYILFVYYTASYVYTRYSDFFFTDIFLYCTPRKSTTQEITRQRTVQLAVLSLNSDFFQTTFGLIYVHLDLYTLEIL